MKVGPSLSELAGQFDLPAGKLQATMTKFNSGCETGGDEFGRGRHLMRPLKEPPFYGIPIWPALSNTQGGPRRNEKAQVLDVFGERILQA